MKDDNKNTKTKQCTIPVVRYSATQNFRKCGGCGKFISNEEMSKDAVCDFTPDTHFTSEKVEWFHRHCA